MTYAQWIDAVESIIDDEMTVVAIDGKLAIQFWQEGVTPEQFVALSGEGRN